MRTQKNEKKKKGKTKTKKNSAADFFLRSLSAPFTSFLSLFSRNRHFYFNSPSLSPRAAQPVARVLPLSVSLISGSRKMATLMAARGGVATSSAARPAVMALSSAAASSKSRTAASRPRSTVSASATTQQLPASHASLDASQAALEQLRAASAGGVNREFGGKSV